MIILVIGIFGVAAWIYLLFGRGFFWLERAGPPAADPEQFPAAAAIVPARNEEDTIAAAIESLLLQDYPAMFSVILIDDHSTDTTVTRAREAAGRLGKSDRLAIIPAPQLPEGWSGKLWALNAGIEYAAAQLPQPEFFLFSDADIRHPKENLRKLMGRAQGSNPCDLVSYMARLHCRSVAEKLMIPAFVFFFEMLYPFRWTNDTRKKTAGAAGGVILLRRRALESAGGLAAIRNALIDDCSLAGLIKRHGRIWLGLSDDTLSLRAYDGMAGIWRTISRTAFTQLRYSGWILAGTAAGMFITYLAPPLLLLSGSYAAASLGAAAWLLMALAYWPTVRFYRLNPLWSAALPLTALIYTGATVDSARRHWKGKGGEWKGRIHPGAAQKK